MQQVGEKWRGAENPEDIEEEDREQAREIETEFIEAQAVCNINQADKSRLNSESTTDQQKRCKSSSSLQEVDQGCNPTADHQVEGFVLIVSSDAAGSVFLHGGTPLGQIYMDILKARYECWKKFHIWVTGMTVDAELNPMARSIKNLPQRAIEPWEAGDASQRKTVMREKLRCLLLKSTEGKRSRGWPAKARSILQELKLVLKIQPDDVDPASASKQTVDLETTLLDQDTSKYSKDQIGPRRPPTEHSNVKTRIFGKFIHFQS
ncbi:hypothetical protein PSTT_07645 [Puccinia striiformis]|uniref:Uncharacterized protein n=1 Tax=Puccinia striiformis TaxID=27350 RepID=A0A2S4VFN2_9BASI|nr:hypothetical protein PSTT_07645 [Puccinia striiformis]